MSAPDESNAATPFKPPVSRALALVTVFAVLYLPQTWYFFMDYPWNSYRISWLKLFPGLPGLLPAAWIVRPPDLSMIMLSWVLTAGMGVGLYLFRARPMGQFVVLSVLVCAVSVLSAFGAYSAFRM